MPNFRLYNKELDIDLEEWSTKEYSEYYSDVHKYALFDESISKLHQWYIDNPDQTGSIFDRIVVVEEDDLKVAVIVINYFESERDNKKVLGINPILINPKYINKGYGRRIIQHLINRKGRIFEMLPDRIYAGIDVDNLRCKHLFESLGFKLVGKTADNEFLYYELEL
ncbi:MAG: GNAT family N-acetyltransferase [Bacilli bacterium]|nr:GNAT family N-acetyltransferase [Bacilli bacterium]